MKHPATILLVAAFSAAAVVHSAPEPSGVALVYAGFGAQDPALALKVVQAVRTQSQDMAGEGPGRRRKMTGRLKLHQLDASRISMALDRFGLEFWQGENEMSPVGADAMEALELHIPLNAQGPTGPVEFGAQSDRDAATWSSIESMAELVQQAVALGLPVLPQGPIQPGDTWSTVRTVPTALVGAPGVTMEVYHFYLFMGLEECGTGRCARIAEVMHVSSLERRLYGAATMGVDLEGVGQADHLVQLGSGGPVQVEGRLHLEAMVSSHLAPGMPPNYATDSLIETVYSLAPLED